MKESGKAIEIQGRCILPSIGGKDRRHGKVFTSKGPRDRRVYLSTHTAIQLYDIQNRLGCDTPSKAVDWLIQKAKTAIDELSNLPSMTSTGFHTLEEPLSSPLAFPSYAIHPLGSGSFPKKDNLRLGLLPGQPSRAYEAGPSNLAAAPLHLLTDQGPYHSQRHSLQFRDSANICSWVEPFSDVGQQDYAGTALGDSSGLFVSGRTHDGDASNVDRI